MAITVTLYMVPLVEQLKTGLWCPKCLKPSGYELPFATLWETGVSTGFLVRKCYDCESPLPRESAG